MNARPVTGDLGEKQQQAVDGPYGPPMQKFVCQGCAGIYFDTGLYFYGKSSIRCIWCSKFPKPNGLKENKHGT